eukprot:1160167-Pelagomonas_calceolata.AAC.9
MPAAALHCTPSIKERSNSQHWGLMWEPPTTRRDIQLKWVWSSYRLSIRTCAMPPSKQFTFSVFYPADLKQLLVVV